MPPLPKSSNAARISGFMAQLEQLMECMNPSSYGPTEPHLWLVGKIPTRTSENCREMSERKPRTHSYDDLVDLLVELAMERETDYDLDKYLHKHLRRETPAEKSVGGSLPEPHSNPGKGHGGQLKYMTENPPSKGKGPLILSTVVLRTIKVDPATRPTVTGEVFACSNWSAGKKPRMVRR